MRGRPGRRSTGRCSRVWSHVEEAKRRLRGESRPERSVAGGVIERVRLLAACRVDGYWRYPLDHRNNQIAAFWSCRTIETDEIGDDARTLRDEVHGGATALRMLARELIRQSSASEQEQARRLVLDMRRSSRFGFGGRAPSRAGVLVVPDATVRWYSRNRLTRL
jgi:hypothetical protein